MTRPPPRVISVVIPVRNAAATIEAQLEGLAAQDHEGPYEVIVVDDRSSDATRAIARARETTPRGVRLVDADLPPKTRNHAAAARNRGAGAARGDLLAFCDADDVVTPSWLAELVSAAPSTDLIAGALDTGPLNSDSQRDWQQTATWQRRSQGLKPRFSTASGAVWADVFAGLGGFDVTHPGAEDEDLAWRARLAGYRVAAAPRAIVNYRYRAGLRATARQRFRWGTSEARLYRDFAPFGLRPTPPADILRAWAWTVGQVPLLPLSSRRRGRWTVRTAQQAGRAVGSARERVLFL